VVKAGRTTQLSGAAVKAGQTAWFLDALMWRRSEASTWRRSKVSTQRTRRRSGHRRVCGGEMIGLGFRGSGTLKKKNSSDGHDVVINVCHYI
jgi:hypothetical protein